MPAILDVGNGAGPSSLHALLDVRRAGEGDRVAAVGDRVAAVGEE